MWYDDIILDENVIIDESFDDSLAQIKVLETASNVIKTIFTILQAIKFQMSLSEDKELTKKMTSIMKSHPHGSRYAKGGMKFQVMVVPAPVLNAFVSPMSGVVPGQMTLFLYGGLVNLLGRNSDEIIAVSLHEIGHFLKFHMQQRILANMVVGAGIGKLIQWLVSNVKADKKFVAIVVGGLIVVSQISAMAAMAFISRLNEKEADQYAIDAGYGNALASSLSKMRSFGTYAAIEKKCGKMCQLIKKVDNALATHPETMSRVQDILKRTEVWEAMKKKDAKKLQKIAANEMYLAAREYAQQKHING